jgi:hypothetical protein
MTKYVPCVVKIHWRVLILEYSQGCYGRTDGSVTIFLRNFVGEGKKLDLVTLTRWPWPLTYDLENLRDIKQKICIKKVLIFIFSCFSFFQFFISVGSWILLVHIWISWFVLVDIGILIYTGLNPVQIRIPISSSRNWNSNLY